MILNFRIGFLSSIGGRLPYPMFANPISDSKPLENPSLAGGHGRNAMSIHHRTAGFYAGVSSQVMGKRPHQTPQCVMPPGSFTYKVQQEAVPLMWSNKIMEALARILLNNWEGQQSMEIWRASS